ncbi:hypothetical protein POTOM_000667 [Populus tomentosa]|uniref:Uncharacterized protein n=1 Tax=Populus tomentosa TaxID=118781 RepID=A0A8X8DGH7_POPTO|nr:hypothetical protein POTOM_000667 [Populus tomentosa]
MITLTTTSLCPSLKPPNLTSPLAKLKPSHSHQHCKTLVKGEKINRGKCRAQLSDDTPFAAAMGLCMLSSLLLPNTVTKDEEAESYSGIATTDTRFAVMGVISFIPYFNWLSWVFAWLDTGKRRYAIYSLVYLAPYLRSNMSLSPEESWLPIASIIFGIVHVQVQYLSNLFGYLLLEASIKNGDVHGFQSFSEAAKRENENTGICHLLTSNQEMRFGSGESHETTQKIKHTQMEVGMMMVSGGNNRTTASWSMWLG